MTSADKAYESWTAILNRVDSVVLGYDNVNAVEAYFESVISPDPCSQIAPMKPEFPK
jgi:hypothetical protein